MNGWQILVIIVVCIAFLYLLFLLFRAAYKKRKQIQTEQKIIIKKTENPAVGVSSSGMVEQPQISSSENKNPNPPSSSTSGSSSSLQPQQQQQQQNDATTTTTSAPSNVNDMTVFRATTSARRIRVV